VLANLKLRPALPVLVVTCFISTGVFAQSASTLVDHAHTIVPKTNVSQRNVAEINVTQTNYVRSYSVASAAKAFNARGIAEPTLPQPLSESPNDAFPAQAAGTSSANDNHEHGLVVRNVRRTLQDQKELWTAPFKRQNFKWDAMFLVGTAALIATDRQSSRAISTTHVNTYRNISNASITGLSVALGGIFVVGLTGDHPHAREAGMLGLETLVNTFLIYTPMQFIAGRERPTEGTGNGRFWQHSGLNTSFPGGHGMFAMAMATTIAHEYRRPWVEVLAYGAALGVTAGRIGAKMHFNSDMLVGSSLGFLIGRHIFYAHCDPDVSDACHR